MKSIKQQSKLWFAVAILVTAAALTVLRLSHHSNAQWHVTVYYTAVEKYHHEASVSVTGCLQQDCSDNQQSLGSYPQGFVDAVKQEGTGRITSGQHAGKFLNWSYDTGYWLDTIPADTNGDRLQPFKSAAADKSILEQGTKFKFKNCGQGEITGDFCSTLKTAIFEIRDEFTPGLGGKNHIDIYIGEEDQADFENSAKYIDLTNVTLQFL